MILIGAEAANPGMACYNRDVSGKNYLRFRVDAGAFRGGHPRVDERPEGTGAEFVNRRADNPRGGNSWVRLEKEGQRKEVS